MGRVVRAERRPRRLGDARRAASLERGSWYEPSGGRGGSATRAARRVWNEARGTSGGRGGSATRAARRVWNGARGMSRAAAAEARLGAGRTRTLGSMGGHVKPRLVVIAGPTGVGKTGVAVALARLVPIEVISADSRQVYRGMDAATGKPGASERAAVVHHLIDIVDPDDRYQAARFRADAAALVERIGARGAVPVVVGGTGLYIRALVRGLDAAPPADPLFRRELSALAAREGRPALWERLNRVAPAIAARLHPNDAVRVIRALEIVRAGGGAFSEAGRWRHPSGPYDVTYFGLTLDRAALAQRLRRRAQAFVAA